MQPRRLFLAVIIYVGVCFLFSCKTSRSVRKNARQTERVKQAKTRNDQHAYKQAYKRHLNLQDDATKKRMKNNIKQQKKSSKQQGRKNRSKTTCPNQQT